jgi:hypothetical protein
MVIRRLGIIFMTAMISLLVLLGGWQLLKGGSVLAASSVIYVAPGGYCGDVEPCYSAVQAAVDAAQVGDEIRVAAGVYQTVNNRGGLTQTLYISKTVTIRGGYTVTNWAEPGPLLVQATILDAQGKGRVVYMTGAITPTLENLHLTGGDATKLSGGLSGGGSGGGILVLDASATISGNQIYSNTSRDGGGLALVSSKSVVTNNTFAYNIATEDISTSAWGGGLLADHSPGIMIAGNTFYSNTAGWGGGLLPADSNGITVTGNTILKNSAIEGAAVFLLDSDGLLASNLISDNVGLNVIHLYYNSDTIVDGNIILGNQGTALQMRGTKATFYSNAVASTMGIGFFAMQSSVTLINNMIVDTKESPALHLYGSTGSLLHNTIARTMGTGVLVENTAVGNPSSATLTNTILAGNTVGIEVTTGNTATLQAILWGADGLANGQDWVGDGTIVTGTADLWGDPLFVAPDKGDYHIEPKSPAVNTGITAGVLVDMDGEARLGSPDIGADEYLLYAHLPLVIKP